MGQSNLNYKKYYDDQLNEGLEFQDYVLTKFVKELGISVSNYSSKKYQYNVGENLQGIEIKYDKKFSETGNFYIEVAEKSNPNNNNYIQSGIFRKDNTWLYVIGNYSDIYIFSKDQLKLLYQSAKFKEVKTPTSIGFLLPISKAKSYIIKGLNQEH
jgi:hypothetical protein